MPSSSSSSRISAASGVSPAWTLPPGNSRRPAIDLPSGRCASSTRPSGSISATAATRTTGLSASAAVAAVDIDVAMRQVAGPDRRAAGADAQIDSHMDLAPGHMLADRPFAIPWHRATIGGDLDAADRDRQPVSLGLFSRFADRHDNAPPIGIARRYRCFDQWGIADRQADTARGRVALGAGHIDRDKFLGAFAVPRELSREID